MTRSYPEWRLQEAVWAYLAQALPTDALAWASDEAGSAPNAHIGARRKARGIIAGVPDLFVWHRGKLVGLELKAGSNGPNINQKLFGDRMAHCIGGFWFVCRTLEEVERALRGVAIDLRATTLSTQQRDSMLAVRATKPAAKQKAPQAKRPSRRQVRVWYGDMRVSGAAK